MSIKAKQITVDDVEWVLECQPEYEDIRGNASASGDVAFDRKVERDIKSDLYNGNEWAWCTVHIIGTYKRLTGDDYLGCCSYASEQEFRDCMYESMQIEVLVDLQKQLEALEDAFTAS